MILGIISFSHNSLNLCLNWNLKLNQMLIRRVEMHAHNVEFTYATLLIKE